MIAVPLVKHAPGFQVRPIQLHGSPQRAFGLGPSPGEIKFPQIEPDVRIAPIAIGGGAVGLLGADFIVTLEQQVSQIVPSLGHGVVKFQGFAITPFGFFQSVQMEFRQPQVVPDLRIVRRPMQRLLVLAPRVFVRAPHHVDSSDAKHRLGFRGIQGQRLMIAFQGFVPFLQVLQRRAHVGPGFRIVRIDFQGLPVSRFGFGEAGQGMECRAHVEEGLGKLGEPFQRRAVTIDSLVVFPQAGEDQSGLVRRQMVVRFGCLLGQENPQIPQQHIFGRRPGSFGHGVGRWMGALIGILRGDFRKSV